MLKRISHLSQVVPRISEHISNYEDVAALETSTGVCKVELDLFRPNGPMQANEGVEKKCEVKEG
jgi:hypothetical protein